LDIGLGRNSAAQQGGNGADQGPRWRRLRDDFALRPFRLDRVGLDLPGVKQEWNTSGCELPGHGLDRVTAEANIENSRG
jgi:hypothetical protein